MTCKGVTSRHSIPANFVTDIMNFIHDSIKYLISAATTNKVFTLT